MLNNCISANHKKCNETHVDIQARPEWIYLNVIDGETICAVLVYLNCEREGYATVANDEKGVDEGHVTTGPREHGIALIKVDLAEMYFMENVYIKRVYRRR
jgi:hypothetical protein